jgi:DNA-binding NarL/FixJ family response regulator
MRAMPETVLIVDDHHAFRQLARRLLDGMGYQVIGECANGMEAVKATARLSPDIVLLDVQLPDIDGIAVAASLNAGSHPPQVVLVSNREAADYGPRLAGSGARGFITKAELSADSLLALLAS